jgi:uncharacterized membrane protein YbhN (UPF0104 family)
VNGTLEVSQSETSEPEVTPGSRPSSLHVVRGLIGVGLAVALLAVVLPRVLGTTVHDVLGAIRAVTFREFVVLTLLWAAGLFVHSFVLTGARLMHRQVDREAFAGHVVATRDEAVAVVRRRWTSLSVAMIGYGVLQAGLLYGCLYVVGLRLPLAAVLAAYAVERLLTVVSVTPGAIGVSEAGAAGLLVAFGGDPTAVAAGVLLYRGFVTALEVPVGGMWLMGWFLSRRWAARTVAA